MTFLIRMIFKFVTKISLMTCCISEKGSLILSCSWSFLILGKRDLLHKFESVVQLRTIFIAGLPDDVKERELLNLLRWLPGYEASQVNFKGEKPMGFALFSTAQFAMAAKDTLQHMVFDAESKSVIHTEMAKKNLFVKRGIVGDSNAYDQSKRLRTGGDCTHSVYSPSPFHPPPPPVWGPPHGLGICFSFIFHMLCRNWTMCIWYTVLC
jgi:hypothetical protein